MPFQIEHDMEAWNQAWQRNQKKTIQILNMLYCKDSLLTTLESAECEPIWDILQGWAWVHGIVVGRCKVEMQGNAESKKQLW